MPLGEVAIGAAIVVIGLPAAYMVLDRAREARDLTDDPAEFRIIKMRPMELMNARVKNGRITKNAKNELDKFLNL